MGSDFVTTNSFIRAQKEEDDFKNTLLQERDRLANEESIPFEAFIMPTDETYTRHAKSIPNF